MARYSAGHVFPCACHSCVSYPRCDIIGVLETYRLRQLEQCAGQLPFWVLCEWFARNCKQRCFLPVSFEDRFNEARDRSIQWEAWASGVNRVRYKHVEVSARRNV